MKQSILVNFHAHYPNLVKPASISSVFDPVDTGRRLNVHKTFRTHPGRLLNVLLRSDYVLCLRGRRIYEVYSENCKKPHEFQK